MMTRRRKLPSQPGASGESFVALMSRGAKLLQEGNAAKALPLLDRAYSLRPADSDAALNLGGAYIMLHNHSGAVPILEAAAQEDPTNSKVWINLGAAYLGDLATASDEMLERAIEAFRTALDLDSAAPSANYNIGLIYRKQRKLEDALAQFRRAAAINPLDTDARTLVNRVRAQIQAGAQELESPS